MATFAHSNNHYTRELNEEKSKITTTKSKIIESGVAIKLIGSKQDWV